MPSLADPERIASFLNAHTKIVEPTLLADGCVVGEWKVVAFVGKGASGEVYRVRHVRLGTLAAMKVLVRDDAASRDRFLREARILMTHAHPVFPRFFGYGESEGRPYLVIELLEPLPLPETDRAVAQYLLKICEGVSFLHGLGLVHRDIKPQNVLQRGDTGQPVLIDLGLVKDTSLPPAHEGVSLSIVDGRAVGVGTPKYAAPEQFAGGEISPAADIHALGMLANECFASRPPRAWERIIRRSTSSIPSQRYATVPEFVRAIKRRHRINVVILILVPLVLGMLAAMGWGVWIYAIRQTRQSDPVVTPKIEVTKEEVVEQAIAQSIAPVTNEMQMVAHSVATAKTAMSNLPNSDRTNATNAVRAVSRGSKTSAGKPNLHPGMWFAPQHDDVDLDGGEGGARK